MIIGLSVLGLAAVLLLGSRLVPTRKRTRKPKPTTGPSTGPSSIPPANSPPSYRQPPASGNQAEQTLILPENRTGT